MGVAVALLAGAASASPSFAQSPRTGSLVPRDMATAKRAPFAADLRLYANCIVRQSPPATDRLLRSAPGSPEEQATLRRLVSVESSCLSNTEIQRLEAPTSLLRGMFAEAMYLRAFPAAPGDLAAKVAAAEVPPPPATARSDTAILEEVGRCLAKAVPAAADGLVRARPASTEERLSLDAITPALSGCVIRNITVKIGRASLRASIAVGLYQLAAPKMS